MFTLFLLAFDCEIPEVPEGVNHSCWSSGSRRYCWLSCEDPHTHTFSEPVPQSYQCGLSGLWDPPRGDNFTFPACAGKSGVKLFDDLTAIIEVSPTNWLICCRFIVDDLESLFTYKVSYKNCQSFRSWHENSTVILLFSPSCCFYF